MERLDPEPQKYITLVAAEDGKFSVKQSLLEENSDYFRGLFNSGMKECEQDEISLPALSVTSLQKVTEYVTTGHTPLSIDCISEVLSACSYLQMSSFSKYCCQFLKDELTGANCVIVQNLAEEYYLQQLADYVRTYILQHITEFSKTDHFTSLTADEIIDYLSCDNLVVEEEKEVFELVLKWLCFDSSERLPESTRIFDTVRFPLMTPTELAECIETLKAVEVYELVKDCITEAVQHHNDPYLVHKQDWHKTKVRCVVPCVVATGGFTESEHSTNRFQLIPLAELLGKADSSDNDDVEFMCSRNVKMPVALCEHCACIVDNFLYVAGGQIQYCQDGRYTRNVVYRFDPRGKFWMEVCPMQTPRSLFYLGFVDGCMYAVGGWRAPDTVTRSVERYILTENRWEYVASLEIGLHEHAGCTHEGELFISGGYKGPMRGHLDKMWAFDQSNNKWLSKAPMRGGRSYHAMVSLGSRGILVAGGVNYLGLQSDLFEDVLACELYNPTTDQWSSLTRMPCFASCMPWLCVDDRLFLFGGHSFSANASHRRVLVLDTKTQNWTQWEMKANKILFFACGIVEIPQKYLKLFTK